MSTNISSYTMDKDQIKLLLTKYNAGLASNEEKALLETWYLNHNTETNSELLSEQIEQDIADIYDLLPKPVRVISLWQSVAAAASVLLFLAIGGYYLLRRPSSTQAEQKYAVVIAPGDNNAILTLSNGKQIVLNGAKSGRIAQQGDITIDKTAKGDVQYVASKSAEANTEPVYNIMTTPRGDQYHLTLSDGTGVWLNAASSIKYPTQFKGRERRVEITGEVYFEVSHNKAMPFRVSAAKQVVEVLGTHFDVNAYSDESDVKTTLLEGSVKVASGNNNVIIKPGQQAILSENKLSVKNADTEEATAWKNGMFRFTNESLESIMRQISRWYNVDIEYADNDIKSIPFNGIIDHFSDANKVLQMLERTKQVHFKIEQNKIIVMK